MTSPATTEAAQTWLDHLEATEGWLSPEEARELYALVYLGGPHGTAHPPVTPHGLGSSS